MKKIISFFVLSLLFFIEGCAILNKITEGCAILNKITYAQYDVSIKDTFAKDSYFSAEAVHRVNEDSYFSVGAVHRIKRKRYRIRDNKDCAIISKHINAQHYVQKKDILSVGIIYRLNRKHYEFSDKGCAIIYKPTYAQYDGPIYDVPIKDIFTYDIVPIEKDIFAEDLSLYSPSQEREGRNLGCTDYCLNFRFRIGKWFNYTRSFKIGSS
jgi:vesicle coat complex subunit